MVSVTSARPSGARPEVPAKITSSILPPRSAFAPCSPSTQAMASTTLLLPEPFGPTTQVMPGSKRRVVAEANDLNPLSVRLFKCTASSDLPARRSLHVYPLVGEHRPVVHRSGEPTGDRARSSAEPHRTRVS